MPKIIADRFIPFLRGRLEPYADITYLDPEEFTPEAVADADALLIRTRTRIGAPLLSGSKVKFVATATIGMDQFDLPWCVAAGVTAVNSPGCNAPAVAQYVWSSILHLGLDPARLTVGVVGVGHVGSIVAEWGRHLGARILMCDPARARAGEEGFITLGELLAESDVVTLHTPLTRTGADPTYHLIGREQVSLMRPGALLINAARGPVVDTPAVVEAADCGKISLVTDTWEGEPSAIDKDQLRLSRIATPHVAGYSLQGKQRATRMIVSSLASHFGLPLALSEQQSGIPVWDLPAPYEPLRTISAYEIMRSYDPLADDHLLRCDPDRFEWLRDHYLLRPEPASIGQAAPVSPAETMMRDLREGNAEGFIRTMAMMLKRYPSDWEMEMERDFHRLLFSAILVAGADVEVERHTTAGRMDMLITTPKYLYIIEFKRNKTALDALEQIERRGYQLSLKRAGRRVVKIGINFSSETRTLSSWAVADAPADLI